MKNHTCNLHIWRDEKSMLKGHKFGLLEKGKGADCTQVSLSPSYWKHVDLFCAYMVGRESRL
jgi:hypothetical protein